jgi:glycerol-3-phosphate responsive antiterminator
VPVKALIAGISQWIDHSHQAQPKTKKLTAVCRRFIDCAAIKSGAKANHASQGNIMPGLLRHSMHTERPTNNQRLIVEGLFNGATKQSQH